jgi:putative ABC transport system permease protein
MGIRLLHGRWFTDDDREGATPVVVISQETARRFWPNEDPIGQRISTGWGRGDKRFGGTIVGVVGDVHQFGLASPPTPHIYGPFAQRPLDEMTVVMRSSAPTATVLAAAREVVGSLDAQLPLYDVMPLDVLVRSSVAQRRFYASLLATFAALALVLAAVGIYGVIAYSVQRRRRELGIRIALGASRDRVVRMVMRQGMTLALAGAAIGLGAASLLTRVLSGQLFGVSATDPLTFFVAPMILVAIALVACVVPARRALSVDPASALRAEN